ncbi:hypothetical protein B4102_2975 [Heyndrickxia sporothermodurans]|uniref:Uncharacterized protein n=1 Tax=Heyndrickxia sporothermodurans TaxID=46224 RepID=A0A150L5B3_9BACI|nr:hypothetical protein B4102_2975 [Heyndrickxia sporothermodurans]
MKGMEKCSLCGIYFWKSQLSLLPNGLFRFNEKYCPQCFPDVLETHTELYYEQKTWNEIHL